MASATQISQLYVALFGRAADRGGMSYWLGQADGGQTLAQIASTMFATEPARTYYPAGLDNNGIIAQFYQNVLGRPGDAEGLAFWTAKLNAPGATVGSVISEMIDVVANYTGSDADGIKSAALFNNKVIVADWFTAEKGTVAGSNDILSGVTDNPASVEDAKSGSTTGPTDPGTGTEGQLIGLTDGRDTKTGTDGNDTFMALVGQNQNGAIANAFGTGDFLDGKGGWDKVVSSVQSDYTVDGAATAIAVQPRTQNIEQVELEAIGQGRVTVDAGRMDSVKQFWTDNSSQDLFINDVRLGSKLAITKDITFGVREVDVNHDFYAAFESQSLKAAPDAASNSRVVIEIADLSTETPATPLANVKVNLAFTINGQSVSISDIVSADGSYAGLATAIKAALGAKGFGSLDVGLGNQYSSVTKAGNTVHLPGFTAQEILVTDPNGEAFEGVSFQYNAIAPVPGGFLVAGDARASDPVVSSNLIETNIILDNAGRGSHAADVVIGGMSNSNKFIQKANVVVDRSSKIDDISSASNMNAGLGATVYSAFQEIDVTSKGANGSLVIGGNLADGDLKAGADGVGDVKTFTATAFAGESLTVTGHAQSIAAYNYNTANAAGSKDTLNLTYDLFDAARAGFSLKVDTGAGEDTVNLNIDAAGSNVSDFVNHQFLKNVTINTGSGDDTVTAGKNGSVANINTGTDADTIYIAHTDRGALGKATWLFNATNPAGGLLGTGNNVYQVFKTKLVVDFQGLESKVIAIDWDATKYTTSARDINNAIKKAINSDPVLSKLLTVIDIDNDGIQIESKVDRALLAGDLQVNFIAPTYAPTVDGAGFNQNASALYGNDSTLLFAQRDKVTAEDMVKAWAAYFPDSTGPIVNSGSAVGTIYQGIVAGAGGVGEGNMYTALFNAVDGIAAGASNMAPAAGFTSNFVGVQTQAGLDSLNSSFNVINGGAGNDVIVLNSNVAITGGFETIKLEAGFGHDTILNFNTDSTAPGTTAGDQLDFSALLDPAAAARGASATATTKARVEHSVAYTAANYLGGVGAGTATANANFDHNGNYLIDLSEIWANTNTTVNSRPVDLDALTATQLATSLNTLVGAGTAKFATAIAAVGGALTDAAKLDGIKFVVRVAEDIQYERDGAGALIAGNDIVAPTKEKVYTATVKWDAAKVGGAGYVFTVTEQGTLEYGKMFSNLTNMGADNVAGTAAAQAATAAAIAAAKVATDLGSTADITVVTNGTLTSTTGGGNDTVTFTGLAPVTKTAGDVTVFVTNNKVLTYGVNTGTPDVTVTAGSSVTGTAANLTAKAVKGAGAVAVTAADLTSAYDFSGLTNTGTKTVVATTAGTVNASSDFGGAAVTSSGGTVSVGKAQLDTMSGLAAGDNNITLTDATTAALATDLAKLNAGTASKIVDFAAAATLTATQVNAAFGTIADTAVLATAADTITITDLVAATNATEADDKFVFKADDTGITITGFDGAASSDTLDFTAFLGGAAAVANAGTGANFVTAGLDLTGGTNKVGIAFNKAGGTLASGDIATGTATSKIAINDNGKAVVLVNADADGTAIADNWNVYYIEDTDTGAGQTWSVTLVGTLVTNGSIDTAAEMAAGTLFV